MDQTKTLHAQDRLDAKKMAILAMLSALAYVVMYFGRIPIVLFLKYDPKDVIIAIAAFIYGPVSGLLVSVVVSTVEMVTASETGLWGLLMNVLSTCAFVCPAAYVYKKRHTVKGAVTGLVIGGLLMTAVMLLWNYLITPIYMGRPRSEVVAWLLPVFLPFNALKAGLNGVLTVMLYKPLVTALRSAKLLPASGSAARPVGGKRQLGLILVCLVVLATLILLALVLAGKL